MESSTTTPLSSALDAALKKVEDVSSKLDKMMQAQETHGEIQLELIKILQRILQSQEDVDAKVEEVVTIAASTSEGSLRGELTRIGIALLQEGKQRAVDLASIKHSANLAIRQQTAGVLPIRVVFLVQSISMWDALADVHAAMVSDDRFDPIIITINVATLGRSVFEGEDKVSDAFTKMGIPHLRFNMENSYAGLDILKALKPAVIFRQQQWDMGVQPAYRTQELTFSRLCYVPYALSLAASLGDPQVTNVSALGFDQDYHRAAWRIFCETHQIQGYFRSFGHSDPAKFVVKGYPKFDRLMSESKTPVWPIDGKEGRNFRVVWAPHYSLGKGGGLGFGVFDRIWEAMFDWARRSPDIDFVMKPHPALLGHAITKEATAAIRKAWTDLPNCAFSEDQYGPLFAASDLLISDGLSFLAEYHLFEKPLIFFDSGNHVPFNDLGKLAEAACRRVTDFEELRNAVLEYKEGKQWEFTVERNVLLDNILPHRGQAATGILDVIAEGIRSEASSSASLS